MTCHESYFPKHAKTTSNLKIPATSTFHNHYDETKRLSQQYNFSFNNSRTGKLNDFLVSDDDKFDNSFHMHLKESIDMLNDLNIPLRRTNMDSKINNNGYKLLELCINFDLRILNGRVGQDINKGKFTCVSESGNSVIDYIIMSSCLVPRVKEFYVDVFDPCLSDKHTPVSAILKTNNDKNQRKAQPIPDSLSMTMTNVSDDNTNSVKTSWNLTKSSDYTNCFDESHVTTLMEKLDNIVELDQNSIDEICKDLCKLLTDPAKKKIGAYNSMLKTLRKPILHPSALIHGLIIDATKLTHFVRNTSKQKTRPQNIDLPKTLMLVS